MATANRWIQLEEKARHKAVRVRSLFGSRQPKGTVPNPPRVKRIIKVPSPHVAKEVQKKSLLSRILDWIARLFGKEVK